MSQHDIHQYYFEKYLRGEMPAPDKDTFEEKLSADPALNQAFEYYKVNRSRFLEDLQHEHEEVTKDRRLNSWIYLLISVTGIVLAVNFYMDNRELRASLRMKKEQKEPFYKRIPFFRSSAGEKEPAAPKDIAAILPKPETDAGDKQAEQDEEFVSQDDELSFNTDRLLHDTLLPAIQKNFYESRYAIIRAATDSLIADTLMEKLAVKSAMRNPGMGKPQQYQAEFWLSPIHYRGYQLNGKKLIIYGVTAPFEVNLLHENENVFMLFEGGEVLLINDKEFHKF